MGARDREGGKACYPVASFSQDCFMCLCSRGMSQNLPEHVVRNLVCERRHFYHYLLPRPYTISCLLPCDVPR